MRLPDVEVEKVRHAADAAVAMKDEVEAGDDGKSTAKSADIGDGQSLCRMIESEGRDSSAGSERH